MIDVKNWRTTAFGILTAVGGALFELFQTGRLSWPTAVACIAWTVFCYLVPDAKENAKAQEQLTALLESAWHKDMPSPPPETQARTAAPATDPKGLPL